MPFSFWICAAITLISALVSLGFSIVALRAGAPETRSGSMYAFARSLALAIVAVVALFAGSIDFVAAVALAMIIVQAADAVIGGVLRDRVKTVGPAVTAVLNLAALVWLLAS